MSMKNAILNSNQCRIDLFAQEVYKETFKKLKKFTAKFYVHVCSLCNENAWLVENEMLLKYSQHIFSITG